MPGRTLQRALLGSICVIALGVAVFLRQTGSTTEAASVAELKPFAHWAFTPDAVKDGKIADQVGTLPGTITGKPNFSTDGPTSAITFTGPDDGVTIKAKVTPTDTFLPVKAFTMLAWVRVDSPQEWGGILGCLQDNGPKEKGVLLGFNKTAFLFGLATKGADDGDGKITYLTGKTAYEVGRWYHVAATYDGTTMRLYVNGQLDGQSVEQSGDVLYADAAPLVLGRYKDDDEDYPMQGALREVLWSARTATPEIVRAHFQADEKIAQVKPAAGPRFLVDPYLQFGTRTSMTVMCETDSPTTCVVAYGAKFPPEQTAESPLGTMHELKLENLTPKTKYFYRVTCTAADGTKVVGKPLTFFTAVDVGDAYTFTVIGDTQKNPAITGKIAKLMWERRPHFVLHMGDVVDSGPDVKEWTEELFRPCQDLFGRVPVYPCIGNHEKNHAHYYKYFSLPKPEYYYSFTYGNAEFFVLDTNKLITPFSEQYIWLDKALANSTAKWKICYHHHPIWSSDSDDYGDTEKVNTRFGDPRARVLIPLYEKHRVDLAMNGHIHYYERTFAIREGKVDPKGVVYLTSGGGGGKLEGMEPTPAFFKNQGRVDYHYCYFTAFGGTIEGKAFDHEGRLFDAFTLKKD